MKVLWVTSQILPLVANELNIKKSGFGGWVMNMLGELKKVKEVELAVVMVSNRVSSIFKKCTRWNCMLCCSRKRNKKHK